MRGHGAIPGLGLGGGIPEVVAPLEQGAAAPTAGGGARARGRGRAVGGSGSAERLRERSELACERDKDGMGGDSGAAMHGSDVESGNGETTTFDGVSRGWSPGAHVAGARCQGGAGWRKTGGAEGGFDRGRDASAANGDFTARNREEGERETE